MQITADFITTGEIQIRMELETADTTLTEGGDEVVLDQDETASLDLDSDEQPRSLRRWLIRRLVSLMRSLAPL